MKNIIEPDPIIYSYDTTGWHILIALLLIIIVIVLISTIVKYISNRYRRNAIKRIKLESNVYTEEAVLNIFKILKEVAISVYGRDKIASLEGVDWFNFLSNGTKIKVAEKEYNEWNIALYNRSYKINDSDKDRLVIFACDWIKNHKK